MIKYLKALFSLNKKVNEIKKQQHHIRKELRIMREDICMLFKDTNPKDVIDKRLTQIEDDNAILKAFIDNLEKIEIFDKDVAN